MISLTIDHRKAIENTALAAGTIAGVAGALLGIGGLSAIAYAPVVLERIIIAGYDKVSPAVKRQFYLVMTKTFNNVEKEMKKKTPPYDKDIVDLFHLIGYRVEVSSNEYSLQKAVEEIYSSIQNEAKWNAISLSEKQIAILLELIVNEFINQTEKYNELSNHLNARGLLEHESTLKKQEKTLRYQQSRLDKHEEQLHNLEEAQRQWHLSTSELRTRILSASIREYEQLHVENNKFHGLRIYEKLFPGGYELPKYYEGYGTFENEKVIPVGQIYTETGNSHIALLGEGGIGKTTFLAHLMDSMLSKKDDCTQIPVYIELNKCPRVIAKWFSEKYGKTDFVTRYIASSITDQEFDNIDEDLLVSIEVLLKYRLQKQDKPEFILLLDGLNEVSRSMAEDGSSGRSGSVREILEHEISVIAKYSNVRIILTSRKIDRGYLPKGIKYIGLCGLKKDDILDHLRERNFSELEINSIAVDTCLLEILRIPLFLCMYASNGSRGQIRPSTRGEILCDFFHRAGNLYAEQRNIDDRFGKTQFEKTQLSFIMSFILPYIGSAMEGSYVFSFSREVLRECIQDFFKDEEVPFWNERTCLFPEFELGRVTLNQVYEKMKTIPDMEIIDCIVNMLGVMTRDAKQNYTFIHQHVRDYFASYYEVQCLRSVTGLWNAGFKDRNEIIDALGGIYSEVWEAEKQVFIGEILREHRNSPILGEDNIWRLPEKETQEQFVLSDIMEIFRYNNHYCGYTLYNIIEIMKRARKNLAGVRFDGLDLSECRLYGASFVLGEQNPLCASFIDTVIEDDTILPEGHLESIIAMEVSKDVGTLYTLATDGSLKTWDTQQERCLNTIEVGEFSYSQAQPNIRFFVPDSNLGFLIKHYEFEDQSKGDYLEEESRNLIRSEIRYYTGERGKYLTYERPKFEDAELVTGIWDMCFDPEEKYFVGLWEDGVVCYFDKNIKEYIAARTVASEGNAVRISMSDKNTIHVIVLKDVEEDDDITDRIGCTYAVIVLNVVRNHEGSCCLSTPKELFRFHTVYDLNSQNNLPAFDFAPNGSCLVYYSDTMYPEWGPSVVSKNLWDGGTELIMKFSNEVPESVDCVTNEEIIIHWKDAIALYSAENGRPNVYHNENLLECRKVVTTGIKSYILSSYNAVLSWSMLHGTAKKVFNQPDITIDGIDVEPASGLINVEFADSSILRLDKCGEIVSSIYYPEYDSKLESSWYLSKSDLIVSVFQGDGFEKILLHQLKIGMTKQIYLDFTDKIIFNSACELQEGILLGFDKKLLLVTNKDYNAKEIWQSAAHEVLSSVEMENERIYLLKEEPSDKEKGVLPEYLVFDKIGIDYIFSEKKPILLVDEADMESFQNDGVGVEQYSVENSSSGNIYKEKGVFLDLNEGIREAFKRSGLNPFQLHTVFFRINDFRKYCEDKFNEGKHEMVMDITDRFILISDMLSRLTLYRIEGSKTVQVSEIDVKEKATGKYCRVKNAVIGDETGSFFYCQLEQITIAKVRAADGVIEWKRQWIPGINIIGCDFRGVTYTGEVEKLFELMGVTREC